MNKYQYRRQNHAQRCLKSMALTLTVMIGATVLSPMTTEAKQTVATRKAAETKQVVAINMAAEASGICAGIDEGMMVTDTSGKVIWRLWSNGAMQLYSGYLDESTVLDIYGEPVGGYDDVTKDRSLYLEPWAITPFLDGYAVTDAANGEVRILHPDCVETANIRRNGVTRKKGESIFKRPTGITTDEVGNLYVADTGDNKIWKVDTQGNAILVVEGLAEPTGLSYRNGALYICESAANRILKWENGICSVVAGIGVAGWMEGLIQPAFPIHRGSM